ncbi:MAG: hypothetical protein ACR2MT_05550 [Aurantibacter sp.]
MKSYLNLNENTKRAMQLNPKSLVPPVLFKSEIELPKFGDHEFFKNPT